MARSRRSLRGLVIAAGIEVLVVGVFALLASGRTTDYGEPREFQPECGLGWIEDDTVCPYEVPLLDLEVLEDWQTAAVNQAEFPQRPGYELPVKLEEISQVRTSQCFPVPLCPPFETRPPSPRDAALAAGLAWLVAHQRDDGSWSFDHRRMGCVEGCTQPGTDLRGRTRPTALALLTLLGAGQTHREGRFKKNVETGLRYLLNQIEVKRVGETQVGNCAGKEDSSAHALATLALCEAYSMTQDRALQQPSQFALNQIAASQDADTGSWAMPPGHENEFSAFGWNLLALKTGHLAYLIVPQECVRKMPKFRDKNPVASQFGLGINNPKDAAIVTHSHILLGTKFTENSVIDGLDNIRRTGIASDEIAYSYIAGCVMNKYGGAERAEWDEDVKDWILARQEFEGHNRGSWYFRSDPEAARGGRLYCTAMALMILELRYHFGSGYMDRKPVEEDDFPL